MFGEISSELRGCGEAEIDDPSKKRTAQLGEKSQNSLVKSTKEEVACL